MTPAELAARDYKAGSVVGPDKGSRAAAGSDYANFSGADWGAYYRAASDPNTGKRGADDELNKALADYYKSMSGGVDYGAMANAAAGSAAAQMQAAAAIAQQQADRNLGLLDEDPGYAALPFGPNLKYSGTAGLSTRMAFSAGEDAQVIDELMRQNLRKDVDALLGPGGLDSIMKQVGAANADVVSVVNEFLPAMRKTVGEYIQGKIPSDVTAQVLQNTGEDVFRKFGRTTGPASEGLVARDLGMTSMQIVDKGMQMAPGLAQFASMPISAAADVTNITNQYRTPLSNVGAMQQNYLSSALGGAMINPATTLQVGAQVGTANLSTAASIYQGNVEAAIAQNTSRLNVAADVYGSRMGVLGAQMQASATRYAADRQMSSGSWYDNLMGPIGGSLGFSGGNDLFKKLF